MTPGVELGGETPALPSVLRDLGRLARERVAQARAHEPLEVVRARAASMQPRGFRQALAAAAPAFIAEVKRASPSEGPIRPGADPAHVAGAYAAHGAAAISVLTEPTRFGGSLEALAAVRLATMVPLLLKDFVVDPYQLWQGRAYGADAALLIASLLGESQLVVLLAACREAGLDPLVEVHTEDELEMALRVGADLVGVNNRDLHSLRIDVAVSRALARHIGSHPSVLFVSESGIADGETVQELSRMGYRAFLVGSHLMRQPDPGLALRKLREEAGAG